jgi:alpha,alpha-trehalase
LETAQYIDRYWTVLIRDSKHRVRQDNDASADSDLLFLPYPYVVPGGIFDAMFYWDSFFILIGLIKNPRHSALCKGIVDNCLYMIHRYGRVLNGNKKIWSSRSQLPFLTRMIELIYQQTGDDHWRETAYHQAVLEYEHYWCSPPHQIGDEFSRYYEDSGDNYQTRHTEASWDMSPRFDDEDTTDLAPVDLNANLYRYETDLATYYKQSGKPKTAQRFQRRADARKQAIIRDMWNEQDGFFYDYNVRTGQQKPVRSLAAYSPLWAGLADAAQAQYLVAHLADFETPFGLVTCDHDYEKPERQWNYPYGWAPLHWLVYRGLKTYGFDGDADRIARKWLDLNRRVFEDTGLLWEKYNVVTGKASTIHDRYPTQHGFGWTNGVFIDLFQDLFQEQFQSIS